MRVQHVSLQWVLLAVAVGTLLSGCTMAKIYATAGNKVALTEINPAGGEHFTLKHRLMFDYTGAIDIQELLRNRYGSGHEFQNVTIKYKLDVLDYLLNLVTLGIANSSSFEIVGDKVR